MEPLVVVLGLFLVAVLIIFPIWATIKIWGYDDKISTATRRLQALQEELKAVQETILRRGDEVVSPGSLGAPPYPVTEVAPAQPSPAASASEPTTARPASAPTTEGPTATALPPFMSPTPALAREPSSVSGFPVAVPSLSPDAAPASPGSSPNLSDVPSLPAVREADAEGPPALPSVGGSSAAAGSPPLPPPPPLRPARPPINWEQFMGAKLFAWLGGLALFLCVAFFVKYSFEHDLIPPEARVAIGFIVGVGLIIGGLKISRERYGITAQTLVGAGVVSLYAVTFACDSIYHFAFFGAIPTFLLMSLITATAFILAVRLSAQVVAILGMLGGFLTPVLINTGHDNVVGLFGYLGLLVIGLGAVALRQRWFYLMPLSAAATVLMMIGWAHRFYEPAKTQTAMGICLAFCAVFFGVNEFARRREEESPLLSRTALAMPAVAFLFALYLLGLPEFRESPVLVFSFLILGSCFVFALAWRERQGKFLLGAALASALVILRWLNAAVTAQESTTVMQVCAVFSAIYFLVYFVARRAQRASFSTLCSAAALPGFSLLVAFSLVPQLAPGASPFQFFAFVFVADAFLLALAWLDDRLPSLSLAAGGTVFSLLTFWTWRDLTDATLNWELGAVLLFAALHTVFLLLLRRKRPAPQRTWATQLFPPLALLLILFPIVKFSGVSFLVWPAILLVDVIAIGAAVVTASLSAVGIVLILTLAATGIFVFQVPTEVGIDPVLLLLIGGFAVFFFGAGLWLVRKIGPRFGSSAAITSAILGSPQSQISAFSSLLPFLLLIMVSARLNVANPSALFGLGLLLVVLTLGLALIFTIEWLPACALGGMLALEYVWHSQHFDPRQALTPLLWFSGLYLVFALYPFVFRRKFSAMTGPWAVAALSGVGHFWVVYETIKLAWPNAVPGAIPALFALAPFASLLAVVRARDKAEAPARLNQLAWFGGVTLFFITLIFPLQFDRQWLTVAWALEGAALLWLFHRVPHPGLRAAGVVLLATVFVRLALNPAVLDYHAGHGGTIFNWYLYAYGISIAALFVGARLLAPPRERLFALTIPPLLYTFGTILGFILLNLEIADYFSPPGAGVVTFEFSGNFARDMSYTVGWALFALGLLGVGIWQRQRAVRYAALALLSVALLKLFFHDLAQLQALYRVGALFAVAVIALLASVAYQRYLPNNEKSVPPPL